jgi:hypothetical protein
MVNLRRTGIDRDGDPARRGLMRVGALLAGGSAAGWLVGCSPDFDWRESRSANDELRMLLPGRPASLVRTIHLRDVAVEMSMTGAEARGVAFTVAIVQPPAGATLGADRLLEAMREQMLRNILATPMRTRQASVPSVDAEGRDTAAAAGDGTAIEVLARGSGPHQAVMLVGRFFIANGRPAQAVVIGRDLPEEAAAQFLDSLRIVRRAA